MGKELIKTLDAKNDKRAQKSEGEEFQNGKSRRNGEERRK
jgi:hypothetical protein